MKKKLSAYWWCQVLGWSAYVLMVTQAYLSMGFSIADFFPPILLTGVFGIFITHLMRFCMIKTGVLQLRILLQIIYVLLITSFFSFFHALITISFAEALQWGDQWRNLYIGINKTHDSLTLHSAISLFESDCFFVGIWNLIYLSAYYIEKNRREQIERVRLESELKIQQLENKNAKLEFQKNLADISLTALRSQMNPHFIFNCLNSIKLYTIENDTASATEYLSKFSKLIRLVMEESAKEKIVLSSELNMLKLYIEMEAMRFKEKLQYKINIAKDVEADYIETPPMLFQPYVENAIWHGLMPKEEGGKIDVDVVMNNDKSLLEVTITDNGIGRAKSAELRNKIADKHKSYAMKVTSERIALINQVYKNGADITVNDLYSSAGKPSGTKVIITIPV